MTKEQESFLSDLHNNYAAVMVQLTFRRMGEYELARDIVQETFLIACAKIDGLFVHEHPERWLFKTLQNLKRRERIKPYQSDIPIRDDITTGHEDIDLPMTEELPAGLRPGEQELIMWRVEMGLTYEEIADKKGLAMPACRQQVSRAMRRCRELYQQQYL